MHVRMARFEGHGCREHRQRHGGLQEDGAHGGSGPRGCRRRPSPLSRDNVRRVMSLVDRDAGVSIDLTFTDDAEAAQKVHEVLDSLSPPDSAGHRTSVGTYELMVDEQL